MTRLKPSVVGNKGIVDISNTDMFFLSYESHKMELDSGEQLKFEAWLGVINKFRYCHIWERHRIHFLIYSKIYIKGSVHRLIL